jgi:hypothetical protein
VDEYGGVSTIAVASDPVHGPLIAVLTTNGTVLAKQGDLSAQWVTEYTRAHQVAVASDSMHGPLIAVLTATGTALAKQGSLSAPWVTECTGTSKIAVARQHFRKARPITPGRPRRRRDDYPVHREGLNAARFQIGRNGTRSSANHDNAGAHNNQICAPRLVIAKTPPAVLNGGSS